MEQRTSARTNGEGKGGWYGTKQAAKLSVIISLDRIIQNKFKLQRACPVGVWAQRDFLPLAMGDCGEMVQLLRVARQFHNLGAAAARVDARNVFEPKPKYVPAREMNFNRFDLFSSRRGPLTPAGHRQGRGKRVHCCLIMMIE